MQNLKIISISPYNFFQKNNGVNNRIYYLNKIIDNNFKDTLFIIRNQNYKSNSDFKGEIFLGGKNKFTHLLNIKVLKKIKSCKNTNSIIFCNTLWGGIYGLVCKKVFGMDYFFDNHNVEFLRFKRTKSFKYPIIKILEKFIIKNSKKTICCSIVDKEILEKEFNFKKNKIQVIENGVEVNEEKIKNKKNIYKEIRQKLSFGKNTKIILFFGSFDYKPNVEALKIIENKIIPNFDFKKNKNIKFIIIGKNIGKSKKNNDYIKYLGYVESIEDYIIGSDVIISPLISGSGTKLKNIESLGYGKKVITTSIGAEGIDKSDNNMIIENDWNEFSKKIFEQVKYNFCSSFNDKYSWSNKEKILINLINK